MIFGKFIAGVLGLLVAGPLGLAVGLFVGHLFDRGLAGQFAAIRPERLAAMQRSFFDTSFRLLGHVAKADGHISEAEIAQTEALMRQLGISGDQRDAAIARFKEGAAADFDLDATLARFNQDCAGPRQVAQTLLVFLISMAAADGSIDRSEHAVMQRVALGMGFRAEEFEQLLRMVEAQSHFHGTSATTPQDQLGDAYLALGVTEECSDKEVKRAYRRLMSEHHPDKLIARGVPESMLKVATEKAQEIQAAYEIISKSRQAAR